MMFRALNYASIASLFVVANGLATDWVRSYLRLQGLGGAVGPILRNVLATRHGAVESGACELPSGRYSISTPVALGSRPELGYLKWSPAMCGHILKVDCGHGPLEIIVSNANVGGGLDLYASSWSRATGGAPPGETRCSVQLTDSNPLPGGMVCYYAPGSEKNNPWFKLLGVFNTGSRIVTGAQLKGKNGNFNGVQPYFAFNGGPISEWDVVAFYFNDGSTFNAFVGACVKENGKQIWS